MTTLKPRTRLNVIISILDCKQTVFIFHATSV